MEAKQAIEMAEDPEAHGWRSGLTTCCLADYHWKLKADYEAKGGLAFSGKEVEKAHTPAAAAAKEERRMRAPLAVTTTRSPVDSAHPPCRRGLGCSAPSGGSRSRHARTEPDVCSLTALE